MLETIKRLWMTKVEHPCPRRIITRLKGHRPLASASIYLALLAVWTPAFSANDVTYTYDALGRLTRAVYTDGVKTTTLEYAYDNAGNRTLVRTLN